VVEWVLRLRVEDLAKGQQRVHRGCLHWREEGSPMKLSNYDLDDLQSLELAS
jgi:hypothetical protein